jgi:release factor glutamine methyltransferase
MIAATNKVSDLLRSIVDTLTKLYPENESVSIARLLFEEHFGISRLEMAMTPDLRLTESEIVTLHKDLQHLAQGIPVQYVIGYTMFRGLRLRVTPDVLIPRPETEELTLLAEQRLKLIRNPAVLDAGTGSGAIAIALSKHIPDALIIAVDHSLPAIHLAQTNASSLSAKIRFVCSDILAGMPEIVDPLDGIVSNPPYIPQREWGDMDDHVKRHEPRSALFVEDADPLKFYRHLAIKGMSILKENGFLMVETHFQYAESVAALFKTMGFHTATVHQDFTDKPRFVVAEMGVV